MENVQETKTYGGQIQTTSGGQHELRAHGNIGVTTTQEMIKQEREISRFNIYDFIIEDFKMRFCIQNNLSDRGSLYSNFLLR